MKRRMSALLLVLLLCGCSARTEAVGEAEEQEMQTETVQEESPPAPAEQTVSVDILTVEGNLATIRMDGQLNYDSICLQGLGEAGELTICIDGEKVYKQESGLGNRWCYVGPQDADTLTIQLPEGSSLEQFGLPEPTEKGKSRLSAYLPYSSYTDDMLSDGFLGLLDELTVNVGCYWRADGSLEIKNGLPEMLATIRAAYPELTIYCTINPKQGGAAAIMTEKARQTLVDSILSFCDENEMDGVDIDWEFPEEDQWDEFSQLIVQLSQTLSSTDKNLSVAFYPQDVILSPEAMKAIQKVNVMAYDQFDEQGRHSTYETAVASIDYFLTLGFEAKQLSLGIPAYGRPLSGEAQWSLYYEYAEQLAYGQNQIGDSYFNSPQLVQDKAVFARESKLQGIFLYHLACDDSSHSLTAAASQVLK